MLLLLCAKLDKDNLNGVYTKRFVFCLASSIHDNLFDCCQKGEEKSLVSQVYKYLNLSMVLKDLVENAHMR
jgi:hypothetical protein